VRILKALKNWKLKNKLAGNGLLYVCLATAALGIHMLYRCGTVQQLLFILKPVTFIVTKALGMTFHFEPEIGFYNQEAYIVINKTCAGTSFWMTVFCMLGFAILPRIKDIFKKAASFFAILVLSYGMTIIANASRIVVAIKVLELGISPTGASERLIHQSIGVLVYCCYLWIIYIIFSKWMRKEGDYEKII
jgi:exosortase K